MLVELLLGSTEVPWELSKALRTLSAGGKAKLFCFAEGGEGWKDVIQPVSHLKDGRQPCLSRALASFTALQAS